MTLKPKSILFYGPAGVGKTTLAVSSFWDFMKEQPVEGRNGRLLLIGREENDGLALPDEMVRRFPVPQDQPLDFIRDFIEYAEALNRNPSGLTDVVVDGWTELSYMFTWAHKEQIKGGDQWDTYRDWWRRFLGAVQLFHPKVLQANVFGTARVDEFRKSTQSKRGSEVKGDPDYVADFKYTPAMEGKAKHMLPHYFNFVVYMEEEYGELRVGKNLIHTPIHRSYWVPLGDYRIKNVLEHKWLSTNQPLYFDNVQWPEIETVLTMLEENSIEQILKMQKEAA